MKKLFTILVLVSIAMTSIVAKSAQVQLTTVISESELTYELYYNNSEIADSTTEYVINIADSLSTGGETEDFTVLASSNKNSDMSVEVVVTPESFKTTLNNGNDTHDSEITPTVNTTVEISTLTAGLHTDYLVNKFNLSWDGNDQLPAGNYVSNVTISYTIT
ncbi:MAG: hypothetical protein PQJ45_11865 [Sphaerochaetaceae bacterium]|nr:hypothetical protein [Sphaerochaetaceae bacterium]